MRNLWNSTSIKRKGSINLPRNLKSTGVKQLMQQALFAEGLRKKIEGARSDMNFKQIMLSESGLELAVRWPE
jgi:hypothetical protein